MSELLTNALRHGADTPARPVRVALVQAALTAPVRWVVDRFRRKRAEPPMAGVREPRRPRPSLPALAVALEEPRTSLRHRIRLTHRRDSDHL